MFFRCVPAGVVFVQRGGAGTRGQLVPVVLLALNFHERQVRGDREVVCGDDAAARSVRC